jgi:hypothetical protein
MRRRLLAVGLALLPAWALTACADDGEEPVVAESPADESPADGHEWERLPDPPIPDRLRTVVAWTGAELLVVGGDQFWCPPSAGCTAPEEPPLADGALLDPAANTWRRIADAPVGFYAASSAVTLDGVVYLLASTDYQGGAELLAYDVATDTWSRPAPPVEHFDWYHLVVAGDRLVAYPSSEETGITGDFVLDPATGDWTPLPEDPVSPAFDRRMVWSAPHLYLLDKENVPNPGSDEPSLLRVSRLDLDAGAWERLPDSELIGGGVTFLADDGLLVSPILGGADGGEVNGWGRTYPNGGVFDVEHETWRALPDGPDAEVGGSRGSGAFGSTSAVYWAIEGDVLDVNGEDWIDLVAPDGLDEQATPAVVAAGRDAVAYVGGEVWIWRVDP